jgi:hypothetical protein
MIDPARLLGFAFASADFLFEIDPRGTIVFATGAIHDFAPGDGDDLVGSPAGRLFLPSEGIKFATFARALRKGDRAGPIRLKLAGGADASLAMFRLPQNGDNISCTLARPGKRSEPGKNGAAVSGPTDRDGFLAAANRMSNPT